MLSCKRESTTTRDGRADFRAAVDVYQRF